MNMFITFVLLTIIFPLGYALLILQYRRWLLKLKLIGPRKNPGRFHSFSIIIPARNEETNIGACLESILKNHYPVSQFEIIVIDDFSTDKTADIVQDFSAKYPQVQLLQLRDLLDDPINSYKKKAIECAIAKAKYEWIITTDADCIVQSNWLALFNNYIFQKQPVLIAAPVMFFHTGGFLSLFQVLDFISLQGITAASVSAGFHNMCNGANLAYQRKAFLQVGGFKGLDDIASGDDMLLMGKIQKEFPGKIGYLYHPGAIVETAPMHSWPDFFNQRIRWASKATKYDDKKIFIVLLWVYLANVYLIVIFILAFFIKGLIWYLLAMLCFKTIVELLFMYPAAKFFHKQKLLWWFPLIQPVHIFYTVISGWLGKFGKYKWKGRAVK